MRNKFLRHNIYSHKTTDIFYQPITWKLGRKYWPEITHYSLLAATDNISRTRGSKFRAGTRETEVRMDGWCEGGLGNRGMTVEAAMFERSERVESPGIYVTE